MNKYDPLFEHLQTLNDDKITLSFDEINNILGFPLDHSFLNYKKESVNYGINVTKISMKNKCIFFEKE